jgi:Flp pilus assembly protein CpaB
MEFEYRDNSQRRGKALIAVGLIGAIAAGALSFWAVSQAQQTARSGGAVMVPVVVAAADIPVRRPIDAAEVTVRDVPADPTTAAGIFTDPATVVGLMASVPIMAGQPIFANMLATGSSGGGLAILEPGETIAPDSENWRAVSLTVPDDRAVGGVIQAGDFVDVFVTASITVPPNLLAAGKYASDKSTKITYQNLKILQRTSQFYVLRVPIELAEEISHWQAAGSGLFSLALRPPEDARSVDASVLGETTGELIKRYALPIPQVYPGTGPIVVPTPAPSAEPTASPDAGSTETPVLEPGPTPLP